MLSLVKACTLVTINVMEAAGSGVLALYVAGSRFRNLLIEANGAEGDRTLNLRIANAALSQLSYRPNRIIGIKVHCRPLLRKLRWKSRPRAVCAAGIDPAS